MHLFVDNLTNVDFSYLDSKRGLVGETWLASIVLEGALDEQGMVCDFGIVKKQLRQWLDQHIDHCLLVPSDTPDIQIQSSPHEITIDWIYGSDQHLNCRSPSSAITLIDSQHITPESVATWCIEQLRALLPESIDHIRLSFACEPIDGPYYHYSHGLKKHEGNCQRIAHGHRSRLYIYKDDQRDIELEQQWCQQWQDIYIGNKTDIVTICGLRSYHFAYEAQQGCFELTLPQNNCYLIDTDTTVEFIAQHIANTLKAQHPENHFRVKAFEGIAKGAIASA